MTNMEQATLNARARLGTNIPAEPATATCHKCGQPMEPRPRVLRSLPCPACMAELQRKHEAEEARRVAEEAKRAAERLAAEAKRKAEAIEALRRDPAEALARCGVPPAWRLASFDQCPDLPTALVDKLKEWARKPSGIVLLSGSPGSGKTWTAAAAIRQVLVDGVMPLSGVYFVSERDHLDARRASFDDKAPSRRTDRAATVGLLVLDDLAASRLTDWGAGEMAGLVEHRHAHDLPTIITSNLDLDGLSAAVDPRAASRIGEGRQVFKFPGRDLRITGTIRPGMEAGE